MRTIFSIFGIALILIGLAFILSASSCQHISPAPAKKPFCKTLEDHDLLFMPTQQKEYTVNGTKIVELYNVACRKCGWYIFLPPDTPTTQPPPAGRQQKPNVDPEVTPKVIDLGQRLAGLSEVGK